jgi:hypothetical protein
MRTRSYSRELFAFVVSAFQQVGLISRLAMPRWTQRAVCLTGSSIVTASRTHAEQACREYPGSPGILDCLCGQYRSPGPGSGLPEPACLSVETLPGRKRRNCNACPAAGAAESSVHTGRRFPKGCADRATCRSSCTSPVTRDHRSCIGGRSLRSAPAASSLAHKSPGLCSLAERSGWPVRQERADGRKDCGPGVQVPFAGRRTLPPLQLATAQTLQARERPRRYCTLCSTKPGQAMASCFWGVSLARDLPYQHNCLSARDRLRHLCALDG